MISGAASCARQMVFLFGDKFTPTFVLVQIISVECVAFPKGVIPFSAIKAIVFWPFYLG
jgi:hypothetical protein